MRHNQFNVGIATGNLVHRERAPIFDRRILGVCRAHMHRQRQVVLHAISVDRLHTRIEQ